MLRFIPITTNWCHFCLELSNSWEESDRSVGLICHCNRGLEEELHHLGKMLTSWYTCINDLHYYRCLVLLGPYLVTILIQWCKDMPQNRRQNDQLNSMDLTVFPVIHCALSGQLCLDQIDLNNFLNIFLINLVCWGFFQGDFHWQTDEEMLGR